VLDVSETPSSPRSNHVLPLAIIGLVVGGICVLVSQAFDWLPEAASLESNRVDALIWWCIWVSIGVFTVVITFLLYSIWKFRAPHDEELDGVPLHGHTGLEIIWTVIPTVIIGVTAVWSALVVVRNEEVSAAPGGPMYVDVVARQFVWDFTYPELGVTTGDLHVPTDRQVILRLQAKDVIHSFFVYETRIKGDAVPGIVNDRVRFTMKTGTAGKSYPVVCAELCGAGHSVMRTRMYVHAPGDFDAWTATAKREAAAAKG
jgi:cytochrome c oxidase subunit 2